MTTYTAVNDWIPPGKNCGACGCKKCIEFMEKVKNSGEKPNKCIFYTKSPSNIDTLGAHFYSGTDVTGQKYDFVIEPLPGEPSARKIILPFRPDIVDIMDIQKDDIVTGRPAGAGCPVQHVMRVVNIDRITGVIEGHVVGPAFSRSKDVKDIRMYHMLGFEGKALIIEKEPVFGKRYSFLPGFCMMDRAHTGLVNMVIRKPWGIHVRLEDVIIL